MLIMSFSFVVLGEFFELLSLLISLTLLDQLLDVDRLTLKLLNAFGSEGVGAHSGADWSRHKAGMVHSSV